MRYLPYGGLVFFIAILTFTWSDTGVFADPDTAWHLAAGDLILKLKAVPLHDSWSFTAGDERWYNLSWLFDILLSRLFALGDFAALFDATILIFCLSIALMAWHVAQRGAHLLVITLLLLPGFMLLHSVMLARPNMMSVVFALMFYRQLYRHQETLSLRPMLPLPFVMLLWVNMHGGFLFAFALMAAFFAGGMTCPERRLVFRHFLYLTLGCLLATLVNPYGFEIYYGAYKTLTASFDRAHLLEWQPAAVGRHWLLTLLLVLVLWLRGKDKTVPLADRLLGPFLLLMAFSSLRYSLMAVYLMLPYLALSLTARLEASWMASAAQRIQAIMTHDCAKKDVRFLGVCLLPLLACLVLFTPRARDLFREDELGFPEENYPDEEADFIETHYPHLRFYNDYNIGGYLAYLWRGRVKLFVDGRASSLYSPDLLEDYIVMETKHGFTARAEEVASFYHLDGLIVMDSSPNAGDYRWNPAWKTVYHGPVATVYLRRDLAAK
jgi:hypothetical protein